MSVPSSLVHQRPDILASEALLHQASAEVGVATANLYPQITLTGSFGGQSLKLGDLFAGPSIWSIGAGLVAAAVPRRRAHRAATRRDRRLRSGGGAVPADGAPRVPERRRHAARARRRCAVCCRRRPTPKPSARESLALAERQFQLGAVSYLTLLNAQRQYHLARILLTQAQADPLRRHRGAVPGARRRLVAAGRRRRSRPRAPSRTEARRGHGMIHGKPHGRYEEETLDQAHDHHADRRRRAAGRHRRLQPVQGLHDEEVHGGARRCPRRRSPR